MGTGTRDATQTITSVGNELSKTYIIVDVNSRPTHVYSAPLTAVEGSRCSLVEYEYLNATSPVVVRMRESEAAWEAAFDFGQPYPAP